MRLPRSNNPLGRFAIGFLTRNDRCLWPAAVRLVYVDTGPQLQVAHLVKLCHHHGGVFGKREQDTDCDRNKTNSMRAMRRHAAITKPQDHAAAAAPGAPMSIEVTGHSLGAALATLYVAENAGGEVATPLVGTFASPRVGDSAFATKFDQLGITSWRIVNELDVVPKLPFIGFAHVATEYPYVRIIGGLVVGLLAFARDLPQSA